MDYAKTINDLRARKGQLLKEADALLEAGKFDEVSAKQDEAEKLANRIAAVEKQGGTSDRTDPVTVNS